MLLLFLYDRYYPPGAAPLPHGCGQGPRLRRGLAADAARADGHHNIYHIRLKQLAMSYNHTNHNDEQLTIISHTNNVNTSYSNKVTLLMDSSPAHRTGIWRWRDKGQRD